MDTQPQTLTFPHPVAPEPGALIEITPSVRWARLPLPYRLDHVNIYLVRDGAGWAVLDTGLATDDCRSAWDSLLRGPMAGERLTRMIVTHYHPDHVGLAGWLSERFGLPLYMPRPEYLLSLALRYAPADLGEDMHRPFYLRHGLGQEATDLVLSRGHEYLRRTTGVPVTYHRIRHGDTLRLGERPHRVLTGGGHALEQAMLVDDDARLFFAADQVIARISPNVSVHPMEPDLDALGIYLESLRAIRDAVAPDMLVLPGHGLPFFGLHTRIAELIEHHGQRCAAIAEACDNAPLSVADLIPHVFPRVLDPHQTGFAFGEVLAHVNYMIGKGELAPVTSGDGTHRYGTVR